MVGDVCNLGNVFYQFSLVIVFRETVGGRVLGLRGRNYYLCNGGVIKMTEEWFCKIVDPEPGSVTVSMYEITEGKPTGDRKIIRVDLDVHQTLNAHEALSRALGYHLRTMT